MQENRPLGAHANSTWPPLESAAPAAVVIRPVSQSTELAKIELHDKHAYYNPETNARVLNYATRTQIDNNTLSSALAAEKTRLKQAENVFAAERKALQDQLFAARRREEDTARYFQDELERSLLLLQEEGARLLCCAPRR